MLSLKDFVWTCSLSLTQSADLTTPGKEIPQNYQDFTLKLCCAPCCWFSSKMGIKISISESVVQMTWDNVYWTVKCWCPFSSLPLLSLWPRITCMVQARLGRPLLSCFIPFSSVNVYLFQHPVLPLPNSLFTTWMALYWFSILFNVTCRCLLIFVILLIFFMECEDTISLKPLKIHPGI